jgi:phosphoglycerol transferase MdoB-like AlkP superfamily enzyme
MLVYTQVMETFRGLMGLAPAWRFEIPLLLYIYFYLNLITVKSRWQPLITAIPLVMLYGIFDVYHIQLGRLLRVTEVTELPEMLKVIPVPHKIFLFFLFGLPLFLFLRSLRFRKIHVMALGALPLMILVMTAEFAPDFFIKAFEKSQNPLVFYSDVMSAGSNGRLSMTLYNEARRKTFLKKIATYKSDPSILNDFDKIVSQLNSLKTKNDVHLLVLESFFDPELLSGAHFSRSPTHPNFERIFKNKGSLTVSPVFGGGTAQAEFEVLCGVPAMREVAGVEFEVFSGQEASCLPGLLKKGGYLTIATNAFVPDFFNSVKAYEGVGFKMIYYPREYAAGRETYLSTGNVTKEHYMFDGDLLTQNLNFIRDRKSKNPGVPLFNYIMSIYGHTPNLIDTEKRPKLIEMSGPFKDEELERAVNQYYYRTEALANYLNGIQAIDPNSLVILIADHLPPVNYGPNTYEKLKYLPGEKDFMHINRVFFFENGKAVYYSDIHHYDIPKVILNYITQGSYCLEHDCDFKLQKDPKIFVQNQHDTYMTIISQAMSQL